MLCGSGVVFKLVEGFLKRYGGEYGINLGWEKWLLDMAGLATLSDMVPLTGENRTIAYYGMKVLRKSPRPGLQKLLAKMNIDQKYLSTGDVTFMITPRINAASRMDSPMRAFELLATKDETEGGTLANHLTKINDERKNIVLHIMKEVKKHFEKREELKDLPVLVIVFRQKTAFSEKLLSRISGLAAKRTLIILSIMAEINQSYRTYLLKVSREVLGVRSKLNKHDIDNKDFINFIDIEEDLNEITGTLQSCDHLMSMILRGKLIKMYEEDVDLAEDVELGIKELLTVAETRKLTIASTREAYSTIMANNLNKTFKKLTSISIFMTIPTITSGLYGMNLVLPLAKNHFAFWYILGIVMGITTFVIWLFKKLKWL
jgi:Mg2+ and Co2+ transporter CorA